MRVAVIGAGAAGLVTARELRREGLEPVVFERHERLGGTWIHGHGALYDSLRTNLPRDLMAFDDHPFEDQGGGDSRRFPGHAEVLRYLEDFAREHALAPHLRLSSEVLRLSPRDAEGAPWHAGGATPPASWSLRWRDAEGPHEASFAAVAIGNGHYHQPYLPPLPGLERFEGRLLHSHDYRRPEPFTDERVVLLGAKSSGTDLSMELAAVAQRATLCARDLPRDDGRGPRHNLDHRPAIDRVEADAVVLTDGSRVEAVDTLLLCTGYRYAFPFLDPAAGLLRPDNRRVHPLHLRLLSAHAATLAFVGLPLQVVPFPLMFRQARWFARLLRGTLAVPPAPERLRQAEAKDRRLAEAGVAPRHRLRLGPAQFDYNADLARRAGDPEPGRWRARLYALVGQARRRDPFGYRDQPFPTAAELDDHEASA